MQTNETQTIENLEQVTEVGNGWMAAYHDGRSVRAENYADGEDAGDEAGDFYPEGWFIGWMEAPDDGAWLSGPFDTKEAAVAEAKNMPAR